jgi:predicted ATP-grasp superfamily ATP-dependent carboligase
VFYSVCHITLRNGVVYFKMELWLYEYILDNMKTQLSCAIKLFSHVSITCFCFVNIAVSFRLYSNDKFILICFQNIFFWKRSIYTLIQCTHEYIYAKNIAVSFRLYSNNKLILICFQNIFFWKRSICTLIQCTHEYVYAKKSPFPWR